MLVKLKQSPMSSRWNFRGNKNGYELWSSANLKTFAKDAAGNWYKVVPNKTVQAGPAPVGTAPVT